MARLPESTLADRHEYLRWFLSRPESRQPIHYVNLSNEDDAFRSAARKHALKNKDDPFAYNRAMKAMEQGLLYADEVAKGLVSI